MARYFRVFFRAFFAQIAIFVVASPVIFFFLVDRAGTAMIAISDWAVRARPWSDRLFTIVDRIEAWSAREG